MAVIMGMQGSKNTSYQKVFERYYRLVSITKVRAVLQNKTTQQKMPIKEGDVIEGPVDKHVKTIYTIEKINRDSLVIHYEVTFDGRSFGGEVIENRGTFVITTK